MNVKSIRYPFAVVTTAVVVAVSGCGGGASQQAGPMEHPSAVLDRSWLEPPSVQIEDDSSVTSVELVDRSDGAGGVDVIYVIDGATHQISFDASELTPDGFGYRTRRGDIQFLIWDWSGLFTNSPRYNHLNVNSWSVCTHPTSIEPCEPNQAAISDLRALNGFVVHGNPTGAEAMPAGMATYDGGVRIRTFPTDNPDGRIQYRDGSMTLNVNFDAHSVSGMFANFQASDAALMIENGSIANNRISADLEGRAGTDMAGVTGDMDGQFYGRDAAEVGGTISTEGNATVGYGYFAGEKQR